MKTQDKATSKFEWKRFGVIALSLQLLFVQSFTFALPMMYSTPSFVSNAGAVADNEAILHQTGDSNLAGIEQTGDGNQAFVDQINNIVGSVSQASTIISEIPDTVVGGLETMFETVFPDDPYTELRPNEKIKGDDDIEGSDVTTVNPFGERDLFEDVRDIKENNPVMDFLETLANNVARVTQDGSLNTADVDQGDGAGHGSVALVDQNGMGNDAAIEQINGSNWGQVDQNGDDNVAAIRQSVLEGSTLNVAYVKQDSNDDTANVFQEGTRNFASILQDDSEGIGGANIATIDQNGINNLARVTQRGSGNNADITQMGDMNLAQVLQDGVGNLADIFQNGMGNEATISQFGSNNMGFISQTGDNNIASITQTGSGHQANVTQTGDNNTAHVVQSGPARINPVIVNQSGNQSIFIHY